MSDVSHTFKACCLQSMFKASVSALNGQMA